MNQGTPPAALDGHTFCGAMQSCSLTRSVASVLQTLSKHTFSIRAANLSTATIICANCSSKSLRVCNAEEKVNQ